MVSHINQILKSKFSKGLWLSKKAMWLGDGPDELLTFGGLSRNGYVTGYQVLEVG
jgi:hypothetical protein